MSTVDLEKLLCKKKLVLEFNDRGSMVIKKFTERSINAMREFTKNSKLKQVYHANT